MYPTSKIKQRESTNYHTDLQSRQKKYLPASQFQYQRSGFVVLMHSLEDQTMMLDSGLTQPQIQYHENNTQITMINSIYTDMGIVNAQTTVFPQQQT